MTTTTDTPAPAGSYKVDAFRGQHRGEVSKQWATRPDDQKYLSLESLLTATRRMYEDSVAEVVDVKDIVVTAPEAVTSRDDMHKLGFEITTKGQTVDTAPSNWTFGQLSALVGAPAGYLRTLPAQLVAPQLTWKLRDRPSELVGIYRTGKMQDLGVEGDVPPSIMRAVTGPDYGRIPDHEIVAAVEDMTNGRWKVPGVMDWITGMYNPWVEPSKHTTTLYASDRDVFMFLCDDTNPIEIGKLPDGSPDLIFRGFYVWNSEVGAKSFGIATMYLRAVCCNRNLWGVEEFQEITMRHSKFAAQRFAQEAKPALLSYTNSSDRVVLNGIKAAREAIPVDVKDDAEGEAEKLVWLNKVVGLSKPQSRRVLETVAREEGHPARSIWDYAQGISAVARDVPHQDARIDLERTAGKLLDKAAGVR